MNDQRFDAFARRFAEVCSGRASRRDLLRAVALGGTAILTGAAAGRSAAAAPEAVPHAQASPSPAPGGPTIEQLALDFAYDPEALFRFVRDEIRYDPYPGVLRGDKGTLWGLAGNAADQSLLLAALLNAGLVETRFVVGELDDAAADRLLQAARQDAETVRGQAARIMGTANPGAAQVSPPPLTPEQQAEAERLSAEGAPLIEEAHTQIDETVRMIEGALSSAGVTLPTVTDELPARERTAHIWLQYAAGPTWVDLDPAFPDAEPGTVYARPTETLDALPDDLFHTVAVRAVAEIIAAGEPTRQELLSYQARAADLVGVPMTFLHFTPQGLDAMGVAIGGILDGTTQYLPHLIVGNGGESGTALAFNTGEGTFDVLGAGGPVDGEALAEWLEVEIAAPDLPVRTVTREIFDRIGVDRRATGAIDLADLPPIELTDIGDGERAFVPLLEITVLAVSGHEVPGSYFVQDYADTEAEIVMALPTYGHHFARTGLALDQLATNGFRLMLDAPNVTALKLLPRRLDADRAEGQVILDLTHQHLAAIPLVGATPTLAPGPYAGALAHAAERLILEGAAVAAAGTGTPMPTTSVGRLFEVARQEGVAIRTLLPSTSPASDLDISARALARITEALAAGYVVIVPERGIALDSEPLTGWWQVDPATGETFDRLETGLGAVALSPMSEKTTVVIRVGVKATPAFRRLQVCIFLIALGAVLAIGALGGLAATGGSGDSGVVFGGLGMGGSAIGAGGLACAGV